MTRRRMIKYSASMAATAVAATLMPPNVRRALAQEPVRRASLKNIKHVVLLMQENRSFDHYFGTMAGVRGFDDPNAMKLSNGRSVFYQPDPENPDGYLLPFHLDTRTSSAQKIPSTNHHWETQHEAWNNGQMDNWVPAHRKADGANGPYTMSYYRRDDIPFQFALAEAFTVCDAYHCSLMGPTWPNRMYWLTGTIDPDGLNGGPIISNTITKQGYSWKTYPERLEEAGVSWKAYQEPLSIGMNLLPFFNQFKKLPEDSPLYFRGVAHQPADQFEQDAMNDNLPTVSWIFPPMHKSEHPDYTPADGAAFVASKIDAIAANPEVWAKTVFILNYDENDGIFDHVAPITPPPGTKHEFIDGAPIGSGYRVPCIIVSPWTAGGWVCSEWFDHTSVLQFLEKFTGVREENISDWRRETFGNLTSAFRFDSDKAALPSLPKTKEILEAAQYEIAHLPKPVLPGTNQTMPTQEKGVRKLVPAAG
ncbi:MAG: alkaline phosphatase family protein [Abditibacteriaceae bacterium]